MNCESDLSSCSAAAFSSVSKSESIVILIFSFKGFIKFSLKNYIKNLTTA